ncbi:g1302 [Coccomyxa elongata]
MTEHMRTDNDNQAAGGSSAKSRPQIRLPDPPDQLQDQLRNAVRKAAAKKAQKPAGLALNLKRTQRY